MRKPDFIFVGMPRSASTWVSTNLKKHPQIYIPTIENTNYFNDYDFGNKLPKENQYKNQKFNDYLELFKDAPKDSIVGEVTTCYLTDEKTAQRIHDKLPNAKIIITLRSPIDWVQSIYWWQKDLVSYNYKTNSLEEAINKSITEESMIEWGKYYKFIKKYYDVFPKENICIVLFKDVKKDKVAVYKKLCKFLGVDSSYIPNDLDNKVRAARTIRFKFIRDIIEKILVVIKNTFGYKLYRKIITSYILTQIYNRINFKKFSYQKLDDKYRKKLLKEYIESINKLEKLINRDLSNFKV